MTFHFALHRAMLPACLFAALVSGGQALAQTTGSIRPNEQAAPSSSVAPSPGNPDGLATGETAFDEDAARERLTRAGYSDITALMQDAQGIWRGTARKDAQKVTVALDRRGKIVAH